MYPLATIPAHPCHIVQLANFLADEEIAQAHDGYIVAGAKRDYSKFIRDHLQGCLVGKTIFSFLAKIKLFVL